jgi:hypothetical protein
MKSSSKVMAGAIVMALTAMVTHNQAALAAASNPKVVAGAPPSFLISARGLSTDSFYSDGEGECTACDTDVGDCGCFFADGSSGGNGYFQLNNRGTTPMTWVIELDYNSLDANEIPTSIEGDVCIPASGFGQGEQLKGRTVNGFAFETTGLICDTPYGNVNYTGSYVLETGSSSYSNAVGSGALSIGSLYSGGSNYVSQIQFTGNLAQGGGVN